MSQRRSNGTTSALPLKVVEGSQATPQLLAEIREILALAEAQRIAPFSSEFDAFLDRVKHGKVR